MFEAELDALGFHFAKLDVGVGEDGTSELYVFSRNGSALFAKKINDMSDRGSPIHPVSCFEAFEALKCAPSVSFAGMSETDPLMDAYNWVERGMWIQPKQERLSGIRKRAWDSLTGLSPALTGRIKPLIGSDSILAGDILAAAGDEKKIDVAVTAAENRVCKIANENEGFVDVMAVSVGRRVLAPPHNGEKL